MESQHTTSESKQKVNKRQNGITLLKITMKRRQPNNQLEDKSTTNLKKYGKKWANKFPIKFDFKENLIGSRKVRRRKSILETIYLINSSLIYLLAVFHDSNNLSLIFLLYSVSEIYNSECSQS